jgi:hypothetical protein
MWRPNLSESRDQASERPSGAAVTTEQTSTPENVATTIIEPFLENRYILPFPDQKATIHLLSENGEDAIDPLRNFFVTGLQGGYSERYQLLEMYDGFDLTLLGERPITLQITLVVYNTSNLNWRDQWIYTWNNYIRATKVVERKERTLLVSDNLILEGFFLSYSFSESGSSDSGIPINLTMVCAPNMIIPVSFYANSSDIPADLKGVAGKIVDDINKGITSGYYANEATQKLTWDLAWAEIRDLKFNWDSLL